MKHGSFLWILGVAVVALDVSAQVGIGTVTPDASAKLEVQAAAQGFLPPRMALQARNLAAPVSAPADGLMVFNTASAGSGAQAVTPGYYGWFNGQWNRMMTDQMGDHTATQNVALNGNKLVNTGSTGWNLDNSGRLHQGLAAPGATIHVENASSSYTNPASNGGPSLMLESKGTSATGSFATAGVRTAISGADPYFSWDITNAGGYSAGIDNSDDDKWKFYTNWDFLNNETPVLTVTSGNLTGINKPVPATVLHVGSRGSGQTNTIIEAAINNSVMTDWPVGWGGGLATFDITCAGIYHTGLVQRSDRRLKQNIEPMDLSHVKRLMQLNPVTYYWRPGKAQDANLQFGLIAQEVEQIFPELVLTGSDEAQTKSVNYQALHALTLKTVQEQQKEIEELQARLAGLEQIVQSLVKGR